MTDSPLPSSDTLRELYARDPLSLSTQDLDVLVRSLREGRARFMLAERQGGPVRTPRTPKAKATPGPPVNLDELEL